MIEFPITMPEFSDVNKTRNNTFHWTENGGNEQTQDFATSGGTGKFVVNDAALLTYWATEVDKAGNRSSPSAVGTIASANDTTSPPAPPAPTVGAGDAVDAPAPPLLGKGKKVK